jgi:4-hydroxybenzoate polyprenyltransferase
MSIHAAILAALVLALTGLTASFLLDREFGTVALSYFVLMVAYSFILKRIVILDILVIASGFVLRAIAGAVVVGVEISPWLLLCTIFLALFMVLGKRRHELVLLGNNAHNHRENLFSYSPYLLDQMIAVVTASTVMAYALYTMSSRTIEVFGTKNLILTIPFVLFGVFRYLYLVHRERQGGNPELILLGDKPMIVNLLLWLCTVAVIIYF